MLKANSSFAQKSPRSTITAHSTIVNKQIALLEQKKQQIILALQQNCRQLSQIQQNKRQITHYKHALTTLELDITKISQSLQKMEERISVIEQEKLNAVMNIQEKEVQLDFLRKNLAQYCKYMPSNIDSVRLKMIELESQTFLKSLQPSFSIKKSIITFLKDKSLIKSEYRFGPQLQISRNKLSQQFKWFAIALLKSCEFNEQHIAVKYIHQYFIYLKSAQQHIGKLSQQTEDKTVSKVKMQQLIEQINDKQQQLSQMASIVKQICKRSNQLKKRIGQLQLMIKEKQQNRKQMQFKIEMIKQKNHCLEMIISNKKQLKQNLLQVTQAIQYFYSKNLQSSKLNYSISGRSVKQFLISPTSCTSLPLCNSIVKSQFIRSPKNKFTEKRSSKLLISTSPKYRRLKSPIQWK